MPEHVDLRILDGLDDPLRHLGFVRREAVMHAGDHDVEFGEQVVIEVQFAGGENIHFAAGQQAEVMAFVGEPGVDVGHLVQLLAQALGGESVRLKGRFRVIGDCPVGETQLDRHLGDLLDRLVTVTPVGVIVQ